MDTGEFKAFRRVLFTEDGKPLPGLAVRLSEESEAFETDDEGQIELPIGEGRGTLEVNYEGEWKQQVVQSARDSSLVMVDLTRSPTISSLDADTSFLDIGKLNLGERYVYLEILGRGGMSLVLKAKDRLLNREVAVKLLSQELQNQPEAQEIFLAEARSLATLSHPNLVAVHDICKVDERVFMVIEHVEGKSLEHLVKHVRRLNEIVTLQLLIQLCRVVAYLHDHGIIHRDLKPANAMIRHDGTLKLIDFGLARHFDAIEARGTRVRGTPAYMAPEQIKGEPLTPSVDIYQIGVCLFECITGRLPFVEGDMGYAHVHKEPPRIEKHAVGVSMALGDIVAACLDKDPKKRPANGQELLKELQSLYQTLGTTSGGTSLVEQLRSIPVPGRQSIPDAIDELDKRPGYSTSEMELMEDAGKHLRTSEIKIRSAEVADDDPAPLSGAAPVLQRDSSYVMNPPPIVIQQPNTVWQTVMAAGLIGAIVAGAISWGMSQRATVLHGTPLPAAQFSAPPTTGMAVEPENRAPSAAANVPNLPAPAVEAAAANAPAEEPRPPEADEPAASNGPSTSEKAAAVAARERSATRASKTKKAKETRVRDEQSRSEPPRSSPTVTDLGATSASAPVRPPPDSEAAPAPPRGDNDPDRATPFLKAMDPVRAGFIHTESGARSLPRE